MIGVVVVVVVERERRSKEVRRGADAAKDACASESKKTKTEILSLSVTFSMRKVVSSTYSSPLADTAAARTGARREAAEEEEEERL